MIRKKKPRKKVSKPQSRVSELINHHPNSNLNLPYRLNSDSEVQPLQVEKNIIRKRNSQALTQREIKNVSKNNYVKEHIDSDREQVKKEFIDQGIFGKFEMYFKQNHSKVISRQSSSSQGSQLSPTWQEAIKKRAEN